MSLMSHWANSLDRTKPAAFPFISSLPGSNALLQHCHYHIMPSGQPLVIKTDNLKWYDIACKRLVSIYVNMSKLSWWWSILGFGDVKESEALDFVEIFSGHVLDWHHAVPNPESNDINFPSKCSLWQELECSMLELNFSASGPCQWTNLVLTS